MKKLNRIAFILMALAIMGCNLGKAQGTGDSFSSLNLSALSENGVLQLNGTNIASFQTFSDAELTALVNALEAAPTIPASSLPVWATCWSLQTPSSPPIPGDVIGVGVWPMADGSYLLNDVGFSYPASPMGMRAMDDGSPPLPYGGGDGGTYDSYTNDYSFLYNTNLLYLSLTNVAAGLAYANLYNATDSVYAIWSTTNLDLPFTNWQVELEVWPTDTNFMPFAVYTEGRQNLFLRAEDWTGVTENGNTTPSWWLWTYFGTTALSDTNLDYNPYFSSDGWTFAEDYENEFTPTVFQFTGIESGDYVYASPALVNLEVAGYPYYVAVLVDDTNFNDAVWNPYSSSALAINLGATQGWHNVWIGLRGHADPADAAVWQWKRLNLDSDPPQLVITNPVNATVTQPIIQIYGYSLTSLASISYDYSNALGSATSQPSEITDQYYDPNMGDFSTNYFECLDVPLAVGTNIITLHATDLAGNSTTTNFSFILDYSSKTNPPAIQIIWPQNNTQISGSNFTCRGWMEDPTATVVAQVVSADGNTNVYTGAAERNGNFWIKNLPLNAGTNAFQIVVTDVVGNTSTTNLSVVQGSLVLTVNPVTPAYQLWQATVNLTGTISDPTQAVWVNGVKGHNNGDGTWSANNVPVNSGGTASFVVTAYLSTEQQPDGSYGN